jgi:hypothetical protein
MSNDPKIENYAGYGKNAPEGAKALRGTNTIEGIRQATEMRREHSRQLTIEPMPVNPSTNRDSKGGLGE